VLWSQGNVEKFISDALRQGLSQLGCIDGKTINLEHRSVGERYDRVDALAAELVESRVDILVAMQPQTPWQQSVPQRQFR
jgi:putative tryptophan/tyrosine transport system substrate-binding protein